MRAPRFRPSTTAELIEELRTRDSEVVERPIPEVEEGLDFAAYPADHKLVTSGLASMCVSEDEEVLGHILVLDLDDTDPAVAFAEASRLDDPAVVLRSSTGCYHVVGLGVRPFDEALDYSRSTASSQAFVEDAERKARFVVRTQPKLRQSDGSVYKAEPEVVAVVDGEGPVSTPHATRFAQIARDQSRVGFEEALDDLADEGVGTFLTQSRYETITDELREAVGPANGGERHG